MQKKQLALNRKPPKELLEMIEIANVIPFDTELDYNPFTREKLIKEYPLLAEYLSSISDDSDSRSYLIGFSKFVTIREVLKALVEISENYNQYLELTEEAKEIAKESEEDNTIKEKLVSVLPKFKVPSIYVDFDVRVRLFENAKLFLSLTINDSHQIIIEWNGLLESIQGSDLRRFRKCIVCKKFFWAFHLNQHFCSPRCSNINRQKNFQSDKKKRDEYNAKRKQTYQSKKELKQGKERRKKNGAL